jgi:NAD-dependent SIR2 family protein deacetylase
MIQFVPHENTELGYSKDQVVVFKEIIPVYTENHMKNIDKNADLLIVQGLSVVVCWVVTPYSFVGDCQRCLRTYHGFQLQA